MRHLSIFILFLILFAGCAYREEINPLRNIASQDAPSFGVGVLKTHYIQDVFPDSSLQLRVGIQRPQGDVVGDILYIHGFGDRLDNHVPLFTTWNQAGFRVIAFDLPSHGENRGSRNNLEQFDFRKLIEIAHHVEESTREDIHRPLLLAGWSAGGLITVRMIQARGIQTFSRPPRGVLLFAPGISSERSAAREVNIEGLTHDPHPPHMGELKPSSTGHFPGFLKKLHRNSHKAGKDHYPSDMPTMVFLGGDADDIYTKSSEVKHWMKSKSRDANVRIIGVQCPGARHELDNESARYGRDEVRSLSAKFAASVVSGTTSRQVFAGSICHPL